MDDRRLSVAVRRATPADADGIARLHYLSHTTAFRPFAPAAWVASRDLEQYRRNWLERLGTSGEPRASWVALEGHDIVGTASAIWFRRDLSAGGRRFAAIRAVHVHPQRIGLGIGRQLWDCVRSFLQANHCARAGVDTILANARARRFFEAAGFRLVRIAPCGVEGVPIAIYELDLEAADSTGPHRRPEAGGSCI
jgi:ribosomal protein S18 acetylase RimI-like enzyme